MSGRHCVFLRETSIMVPGVDIEQSKLFDGEVAVQRGDKVEVLRDGQKVQGWDQALLCGTDMSYADARIAMRGMGKLLSERPHVGRALRVRRLREEWEHRVVDEVTSS